MSSRLANVKLFPVNVSIEEELSYPFNPVKPAVFLQNQELDVEFWSEFVTKQTQLDYLAISFDIGDCQNVTTENLERITEQLHGLGYKTVVVIDRLIRRTWVKKTPYETANRMTGAQKYIPIRILHVIVKSEYLVSVKDTSEP